MFGSALLAAGLVGPSMARGLPRSWYPPATATFNEPDVLVARIGPGTPYIHILEPGAQGQSFAPTVRHKDFVRSIAPTREYYTPKLAQFVENTRRSLVLIRVFVSDASIIIVGSPEILPLTESTVRLKGSCIQDKGFNLFLVSEHANDNDKRGMDPGVQPPCRRTIRP